MAGGSWSWLTRFSPGSVDSWSCGTMMHHSGLAEVVRKDPRYAYEAYEFVFAALHHTQKLLGRQPREHQGEQGPEQQHHVSGKELLQGVRDLALREFGLMARTVFR